MIRILLLFITLYVSIELTVSAYENNSGFTIPDIYADTPPLLVTLVGSSLKSDDVLETFSTQFITEGVPDYIRSYNGTEFTAKALREWLENIGVKTAYIEPSVSAYEYNSGFTNPDIYADTPPLLVTRSNSIDLTSKESNLHFQKTAEKNISSDFGEFARASLIPYTWNWAERFILAQNNVKQVYTEFLGGYLKNISGWQECKLIYCSQPYQKSPFWDPPLNDGDYFRINYIEHPVSGMATYLYYRAVGFDRTTASFGSLMHSILFEYTIEGFQQPPSFNDIILTPLIGVPFGIIAEVSSDWLSKRDSQFLRALSYIVNPTKILIPDGDIYLQGLGGFSFRFNL